MTTPNAFGVDDEFGAGGIGLAPDGASGDSSTPPAPPFTAAKNARDMFRAAFGAVWPYPFANTAGLTASLAVNRQNGQRAVTLDTFTVWVWKTADSTAADATHIAPTDVGVGAGRWVAQATTPYVPGTGSGEVQKIAIDVPQSAINAAASGVPFNIGAALPANFRITGKEIVRTTALSGGSAASAHATVQNTGETAGALLASTDVFTGSAAISSLEGSNPYPSRGGQQLQMTITGDGTHALSTLTAGHLVVNVFGAVVP